mmetsp:Transcript_21632/g.50545  ORF Transcript_21632/g.50545 Transcript_21632/m.50545 type:complete len:287 (+) Transcript_21632:42-902(+)
MALPFPVALRQRRSARVIQSALLVALVSVSCWRHDGNTSFAMPSRRSLLASAPLALWSCASAHAFENALPEVAKFPNNRNSGTQPKDLGLAVRQLNKFDTTDGPVLKECGYGPNCFSTTGDVEDPFISSLIPRWQIPAGSSTAEAMEQLAEVVRTYPPGQSNLDGGGFQIVTLTGDYLYAQFESLKKGRIDDVEFVIDADGSMQVRSSGRIGRKADFGSNVKRLNYFSAKLRALGWKAPEISKDTHPYYFAKNAGKSKVQCVGVNCPVNFELPDEEPGGKVGGEDD